MLLILWRDGILANDGMIRRSQKVEARVKPQVDMRDPGENDGQAVGTNPYYAPRPTCVKRLTNFF